MAYGDLKKNGKEKKAKQEYLVKVAKDEQEAALKKELALTIVTELNKAKNQKGKEKKK